MNTRILVIILLAVLLVAVGVYALTSQDSREAEPMTFEECAALYPVMESFPRQCATPSGIVFIEAATTTQPAAPAPAPAPAPGGDSDGTDTSDLIRVDEPDSGDRATSPLVVTGEARGTWYFEASFPVELRNAAGAVIVQHYAEAQDDWMTEDFVPFRSTITFPAQPAGSRGTLILRKDNPSGDPARDQSVSIPIVF